MTATRMILNITIAVGAVVLAGASRFGWKQYRKHIACRDRRAAFARQIKSIEQAAHEQLKIGTKREDVSRFFTERGISFAIVESKAFGTLETLGCAPFGCGTDAALIGVRVNLDSDRCRSGRTYRN
jgi:hypothetical protein